MVVEVRIGAPLIGSATIAVTYTDKLATTVAGHTLGADATYTVPYPTFSMHKLASGSKNNVTNVVTAVSCSGIQLAVCELCVHTRAGPGVLSTRQPEQRVSIVQAQTAVLS